MNDQEKAYNDFIAACDKQYAANTKKASMTAGVIPWGNIIAIIPTLVTAFCPVQPNAKTIKTAAATPSALTEQQARVATRQALVEKYGLFGYRKHDGEAVAHALMQTAAATEEPKLQMVMDCCGV